MPDKIKLPNITLMIVDSVNAVGAAKVLDICQREIEFGAVKLLTHIPIDSPYRVKIKPLNSLVAYSIFCLTKMWQYFDTPFVMTCQRDGFILNPRMWRDEFLDYDYIGSLFVQMPVTGSGGFSIRSKRVMEDVAKEFAEWDWTQKMADELQSQAQMYEDGVLSISNFAKKYKIAPPEIACEFSQGGQPNRKFYRPRPFGFHGLLAEIDHTSGIVSPVCEHPDNPNCGCTAKHTKFLQENVS